MAPKKSPGPAKSPKIPTPWVASTALVVRDREASARWYHEVLGMEVLMSQGHWTTVGHPKRGAAIHLCQADENTPKAPLEPGNSGVLLLIDGDFQERCRELRERGVPLVDGPTKRDWGWDATLRDPDGNELLLMPEG